MKKHVVYVPKVGTWVDGGIGYVRVDKPFQERKIAEAKEQWKRAITCELMLVSELLGGDGVSTLPHFEYKTVPNPYYGWKESQLKIVKR